MPSESLFEATARRARDAAAGGFLVATDLRFRRDAVGLWLQVSGVAEPYRVTAVRPAFPLSLGPEMLVVYGRRGGASGSAAEAPAAPEGGPSRGPHPGPNGGDEDVGEEEIGILRSLAELDPATLDLIAEEVEKAYFVPRITRVLAIEEEFGVQRWEVQTDRGPRSFEITERSQIRPFDHSRMVIKDVDGNRYQIADTRLLDRRSQQWLDLQI